MVPIDRKRLFIDGVSDFDFWVPTRQPSEHQPPSTMSADSPFSTPTQTSTKAGGDLSHLVAENAEEPLFDKNPQAGIFAMII